jgi:hypothetical protein
VTTNRRIRRPERGEAAVEEAARTPVPEPALLALQRAAGNAATARWLARQPTTTAPPVSKIAQLDELLDHSDVDEEAVLSLLAGMNTADKAAVISGNYRDKLADAFNTGEMVRAVTSLRPPLYVQLDWVRAAAGSAKKIDYPDIAKLVQAAPQPERDALNTSGWREFFVDVCSNDTIVAAVTDLHFDLGTKLRWVVVETSDLDWIKVVIRFAPTAELAPVLADKPMMAWLRDELGAKKMLVVEQMLNGLLGVTSVENTTDTGNEYEAVVSMWRNALVVSKHVKFIEDGTFAAGAFDALKARLIAAVTTWLSRKYKIKIASPGAPQPGDGEYPIEVICIDDPSADYPMHLHGGESGRSGVDEDEGNIFEKGQGSETSVPDITLAHESAHMMLGASDEYANAKIPHRVVTNDHSLMGDFYTQGIAAAEIKARHFQFLVGQVSAWFPGRAVSIIK